MASHISHREILPKRYSKPPVFKLPSFCTIMECIAPSEIFNEKMEAEG